MNTALIEKKFGQMGARVQFGALNTWATRNRDRHFSIDVDSDEEGEFFKIESQPGINPDALVLDVKPNDRDLLLMVKGVDQDAALQKFLCAHDERHWFVAAVPEDSGASNVADAQEALKPEPVRTSQAHRWVKRKNRNKRRNAGFVRQDEWFFIPEPDVEVDERLILRKEPIRRGSGKPHVAELAFLD